MDNGMTPDTTQGERKRNEHGDPHVLWISREAIALTLEDCPEGEGVKYLLADKPAPVETRLVKHLRDEMKSRENGNAPKPLSSQFIKELCLALTPPAADETGEALFKKFERHWHYCREVSEAWALVCRDLQDGGT